MRIMMKKKRKTVNSQRKTANGVDSTNLSPYHPITLSPPHPLTPSLPHSRTPSLHYPAPKPVVSIG